MDRATRLLRDPQQPRQASYLELFFDLAFIVGLTLLSQRLLHHLVWVNLPQSLVLLAGMWWVWIATAWSTDWFNPAEPFIQRLVIFVMFASLLMSASVAEAFGPHGIVFAAAYSSVHIVRGLVLATALRGHPLQRRSLVVLVWFALSSIPWLVGAFVPQSPRLALWIVAVVIDYGIAWFGWPTPRLGRVSDEQLRIIGEHLTERYRQVFVIALGEIVLVSGITFSNSGFDFVRAVAMALAFGNAVLLWWLYLERAFSGLDTAIDRNPPRVAVTLAYCHLIMIAGTVLTAVGAEMVIGQPLGVVRASWSAVIVGGPEVFLVGRNLVDFLVHRRVSRLRVLGLVVIAAITPALLALPPLFVAIIINAVLFAVAMAVSVTNRHHGYGQAVARL